MDEFIEEFIKIFIERFIKRFMLGFIERFTEEFIGRSSRNYGGFPIEIHRGIHRGIYFRVYFNISITLITVKMSAPAAIASENFTVPPFCTIFEKRMIIIPASSASP